jgi:hypothetical protein
MPDDVIAETVLVSNTARTVLRTLRTLIALTFFLAVGLVGTVWYVAATSGENRDALCAFREDVTQRAQASSEVLSHGGIRGLSAETLRKSVEGQQRTVRALSGLSC